MNQVSNDCKNGMTMQTTSDRSGNKKQCDGMAIKKILRVCYGGYTVVLIRLGWYDLLCQAGGGYNWHSPIH